eukprot:Skav200717  [mRNA]  locus=scaffold2650:156095:157639:- [translate_table: standard]
MAPLEGPLTSNLTPDSFPTRVVELGTIVIAVFIFLLAAVICHEIYASCRKPLLANHEQANSNWVQVVFLMSQFQMFFQIAMEVPVSLDFCLQMGQSATMSGFMLSFPIIGSMVGIFIGPRLISEAAWNQRFARRLMIGCSLVASLCSFAIACTVNHAAHHSLAQRRTIFWIFLSLMQLSTVVSAIPTVPMQVMQNKLTPTSEKTFWMLMVQCARNGGMLIGPGFFALVAYAVKRGVPVSPGSLLAWVSMGNLILGLIFTNYFSWTLPTELVPLEDEPSMPEKEACVTMLPAPQRERVVKNMVWYSFERPFSISAIEVGTIMLLEVSYGWSTELCGTIFTVVSGASLLLSAIASMLLHRKYLAESSVFFGANLLGLIGVLFLFDFGTGAAGLLIADGMVYGMANVSNGIAQGWASKAAMPNTGFSIEIYRLRNNIAVCLARFTSPIVARTLLDFGGRNVYAGLQLLVVFLGTGTVYITCKLVWDYCEDEKLSHTSSSTTTTPSAKSGPQMTTSDV